MIRITDFVLVGLSSYPKDPNTVFFEESLDDFLDTVGGWEALLFEIAQNRTRVALYFDLNDLIRFLSVFVRSLYPEASADDRCALVTRFLDQHLVASLYYRGRFTHEDLDLRFIREQADTCPFFPVPREIGKCLAFEFLYADYLSTQTLRPEFLEKVQEVAYENFVLHITILFDSIFEGNFESVFIDIPDYSHPAMDLMKDAEVPLFFSNQIDLEKCVSHVLSKYSKEYLQDLAVRVLALRTPKRIGSLSNGEFVRKLYGERYDQIVTGDWKGFIESELGLSYAIFFSKATSYWRFSKRVIDYLTKEKPVLIRARYEISPESK